MRTRLFQTAFYCFWASTALLLPAAEPPGPLWLHPICKPLPTNLQGPFVKLGHGGVLGVHEDKAMISLDGGRTWEARPMFSKEQNLKISNERALLRTRDGTILAVFLNAADYKWGWDEQKQAPIDGIHMNTWVARSTDKGRTWEAKIIQPRYWCGDVRDMIQTREGRIIVTLQRLLPDPTRHATIAYTSDDDGKSWEPTHLVDVGGRGHHDGSIEATIAELRDGRIWMLLRTNLDQFWQAFSEDGGRSWRKVGPSGIDASSAPGLLKRLQSGRLILIWNRLYPEGQTSWPRTAPNSAFSKPAASVFREEVSAALSDDDGKTWTKPLVIARRPRASLAYPHLLEYEPGLLWLTTMQGNLRLVFREDDLLKAIAQPQPTASKR